jgi:hypothetical protein
MLAEAEGRIAVGGAPSRVRLARRVGDLTPAQKTGPLGKSESYEEYRGGVSGEDGLLGWHQRPCSTPSSLVFILKAISIVTFFTPP